jgi:hypothetical protein
MKNRMCDKCGTVQSSFELTGGVVSSGDVGRLCAACPDAICAAVEAQRKRLTVKFLNCSAHGYKCRGLDGSRCPHGSLCELTYRTVGGRQLCSWCQADANMPEHAITPAEFAKQGYGSSRGKRSRTSAKLERTREELEEPVSRKRTRR